MDASDNKKKKNEQQKISVMNWIGTMILCTIPGVNILALLGFALFSKVQAKRSFAAASLILLIVCVAAVCAVFLIFPEQLAKLASDLRGSLPQTPAGNVLMLQ